MNAARPPAPLIAAADLACRRGGRRVFSGVSFSLAAGSALLVTGPNGSGKSSLLRLLAGLGEPESGRLVRAASLAFLGHANCLKPHLTVRQNLAYWARLGVQQDPADVLDALGLASLVDLPVRVLSQGQQRRAALARLFATSADMMILDEPTAGLDAHMARQVSGLLQQQLARGGGVIAAIHDDLGIAGARLALAA